jgi:phosphoribosylformylglycinamidine cyclo-ligase
MIVITGTADEERVAEALRAAGERPVRIGEVIAASGSERVRTTGGLRL